MIGFLAQWWLPFIGVLCGEDGVSYYGEVHLSALNSNIHTLCMPITSYGIILALPALFNCSIEKGRELQRFIFWFYFGHYMTMDVYIALLYFSVYIISLYKAYYRYEPTVAVFLRGISIAILTLSIQEYFGHYIGGDKPSRIEGVPNAILYANYYAIQNGVSWFT